MRTGHPLSMAEALLGGVENPYRVRTRQRTVGQIQYERNNTSIYTSRYDSFHCRATRAYNNLPQDLIGKYYTTQPLFGILSKRKRMTSGDI